MRHVHIEGMGWLGSLSARLLAARGVPFTWHDTDYGMTAWKASTGLVYPSDSDLDNEQLRAWLGFRERLGIRKHTETVHYVQTKASLPRGGNAAVSLDLGWAKVHKRCAIAVDVPAVVRETREHFIDRVAAPPADALVIRAHPANGRLRSVRWGWSARAELEFPDPLPQLPLRSAITGRLNRSNLTYAYPYPGGGYLIGTASILQSVARPRPIDEAATIAEWTRNAERLLKVRPVSVGRITHGWRPSPLEGDTGLPALGPDGSILMPQMAGNGVRRAPRVLAALEELLP